MNLIKRIWVAIVHPPKARELAIKELENAKRNYLENQTLVEYYSALRSFDSQRIARLEKYLEEPSATPLL
jgi:hypothetical protein